MKRNSGFIFNDSSLFPTCHGSTIETLPNGDLMCAWFGGTRESDPDTAIYCSTLDLSKNEWNEPSVLAKVSDEAHWNPVLFKDEYNCIHLFFKVGSTIQTWKTWHCTMENGGSYFSSPELLIPGDDSGGRGPVRNKPLVLSNGDWVAPSSHEETPSKWDSFVDISSDHGLTWSRSPYVDRVSSRGGLIQPALWESPVGCLHMYMRSTYSELLKSSSFDYGKTWSTPTKTGIPNNNSSVDVLNLGGGVLAMAYNPIAGNWAGRTPISLSFSRDNGDYSWTPPYTIEHSYASKAGFAYPSVTLSPKGLYMSYTWNRVGIRCIEVELSLGMDNPIVSVIEDMSVPDEMLERMRQRKSAIIARKMEG